MDSRFEIHDRPREVTGGVSSDVPMISVVWRALRSDYQRRAADIRDSEQEARKTQDVLASAAEEVHRLLRAAAGQPPFAEIARCLEEILQELGVSILAPEGDPYTSDLMEVLENIAQKPEDGISGAFVAEVVKPAVLCRGAVIRMGKAIIAVPRRIE